MRLALPFEALRLNDLIPAKCEPNLFSAFGRLDPVADARP
jgi:hypothetical protein